jgi:hypothetical protein
MFYEHPLTIPANTPATSPFELEVELDHGRIVGVELQFPRGCVGLVHVQVRRELHQLWPTNVDGDISGEDARIGWVEDHDFTEEPYTLTLRGWNLDDTFQHTVTFRFNLLPLPAPAPPPPPAGAAPAIIEVLELS